MQRTVEQRNLTPVDLTPVEARQGFLDRPVLMVLVASTLMIAVIFALLLLGL